MNMGFGLYQQQSMKLVMTNELRQAITMLQYSTVELQSFLKEKQLENPLIELQEIKLHEEVERSKISATTPSHHVRYNDGEESFSPIDVISKAEDNLHDYLLSQIGFLSLGGEMNRVVTYLALTLDESGYLPIPLDRLSEELEEPIQVVEEGLRILQELEPTGIGARSLKECLLLQLKKLEVRSPLAEAIVEHHLPSLAKKQLKKIAKEEKVTVEEVQGIFNFIKRLNPKPGALFHNEPANYIVPDVTVKKIRGDYYVFLNDQHLPKIIMNPQYEALLQRNESEISEYMRKKYEQFQWIQNSIRQRQETLLKVTKAIVELQRGFLDQGITHLKPLTLKVIADKLNIHESTVSRATTKKYVQTPRGVYELKYFFTSSVGNKNGGGTSSEKVKTCMKGIIDQEDKKKPHSDQKISTILKEEYGIKISRRTVAKYREELHIPSSSMRKQYD